MILDTNTYSAFVRKNFQVLSYLQGMPQIGMPFVVLAELRAGFLGGDRSAKNEQNLLRFLALPNVSVLDVVHDYIPIYAELQYLARRQGKTLANNDIWIAAITAAGDDRLLTYDQDFTVFKERLGDKLILLQH